MRQSMQLTKNFSEHLEKNKKLKKLASPPSGPSVLIPPMIIRSSSGSTLIENHIRGKTPSVIHSHREDLIAHYDSFPDQMDNMQYLDQTYDYGFNYDYTYGNMIHHGEVEKLTHMTSVANVAAQALTHQPRSSQNLSHNMTLEEYTDMYNQLMNQQQDFLRTLWNR